MVDAAHQSAASHLGVKLGAVKIAAADGQAHLVQHLAGVAGGIDIGDIVTHHAQALLGGVNAQSGSGKGSKRTDTHMIKLLNISIR